MQPAPIPANEQERLAELHALRILDTAPETRFDAIVQTAKHLFDVPVAYIALIDADRQWFKAKVGLNVLQTPRKISFCGHAIAAGKMLIVEDTSADARFADSPLVEGDPFVRFYAGVPLAGPTGKFVGTLCVVDRKVRSFSTHQISALEQLGKLAEQQLQMVDIIAAQRQLLAARAELLATQQHLARELKEASEYVHSLLPVLLEGPVDSRHELISSSDLGGDLFGYHWLDDEELAVYLLDVCGHGVGASLLSISAYTSLRRQTLPEVCFSDPGIVLESLNRAFPMEEHGDKFFTAWYGVYHRGRRELQFAGAGHPPAILVLPNGKTKRLGGENLMIGVMPDERYETLSTPVPRGSRLYVFSDGVFEVNAPDNKFLGLDGLESAILEVQKEQGDRVALIRSHLQTWQGTPDFIDDFSLIELQFN